MRVARFRRGLGLAAFALIVGFGAGARASDTRTLTLHHIHTNEDITITYKKNGEYDQAALKRLDVFVRDWRKDEEIKMDPRLYDYMWEVQREVGHKGAIHIVCGYRTPTTNSMLRSRSGGVAQTSLHMQGKAMDFSLPGADVAEVRAAALRIQGGGVGYYPTSGIAFVHVDVGNVRHWPRMTRDQLAKVFPNGRTLHVPTDGNPLPNYELALADAERGTLGRSSTNSQRNLLAALFSGVKDQEEVSDAVAVRERPASAARGRTATTPAPAAAPAAPEAPAWASVPLPPNRPTFQIASAESRPAPAPAPRAAQTQNATVALATPNDMFSDRAQWVGLPDTQTDAPALALSASRRTADPEPTASLGPFARTDRVPADLALAYAAHAETPETSRTPPLTVVTTKGSASIAARPPEPAAETRPVAANDRLDNPWLRGVVMAPSLQNSMTTTLLGAPDFRGLRPFMHKPASSVMMTFSSDPYLGMTTNNFTGSAVVFQATVTFGLRTANLR